RLHARDRSKLLLQTREEGVQLVARVVPHARELQPCGDRPVRIETRVNLLETKQAPNEQRGTDAQHERERHLTDHEPLAPATHAPALTSAAVTFLERVL